MAYTVKEMKMNWKRIPKWVTITLGIYIIAFVPLWLGGGYILTESGRVRQFLGIQTGIAAPDVAEWQPLIGHFQPDYHWPTGRVSPRCDFIGWAYYPLWQQVQYSHPSVQLLTDRGTIVEAPSIPPRFRLHPIRGRELRGIIGTTPCTQ